MSDKTQEDKPKVQRLQTAPGIHDVLPKDHQYHTFIKKVVRHRARQAGFTRITTPVMEFTEVFERGVGEHTDVVEKEMYTFEDRSGRSMTLKPEGTAGVVRSYLQHGMGSLPQPVELFYIEPHFRYDRPQKGRYRMFWQFGFEVIGESDPALDVQLIQMAFKIFEDLGLGDKFDLQINNIGTKKSREKYHEALVNYYVGKERSLCDNCKDRLHKNPMRLLDCKEEDCQILAGLAPKFEDYRSKEDKEHHERVREYLEELEIPFTENDKLVRGLDYYTQTVWEFWDKSTGGQNAVGGGGRYDALVEIMGGPETPAVGFACGMDRIIMHMKQNNLLPPAKDNIHVLVAQLGDLAKKKCLRIIEALRDRGVKTVGSLGKGSIKSQLKLADKHNVPYALILGSTEVRDGTIIIRDMSKGQQQIVSIDSVVDEVVKLIGEDKLDRYSPGEVTLGTES